MSFSNSSESIKYMNITKALGIIAIVFDHSMPNGIIARYPPLYALPLFYFISGYFYKDKYSAKPLLLITRRFKTLYLPFIYYCLAYLALHNLFLKLNIYSDQEGLANVISPAYSCYDYLYNAAKILLFHNTEPLAGALWFLASLSIVNILFSTTSFSIRILFNKDVEWLRFILILSLFLLGFYITTEHLSRLGISPFWHFNTSMVALIVYYMGYLYKRHEQIIRDNNILIALAISALLLAPNFGHSYMSINSYSNPVFFIMASTLGIYVNLNIAKKIDHNRFLDFVGKNTINILGLHFLAFKIVSIVQVSYYNYPAYKLASFPVLNSSGAWWVAYFSCGLLVPLIVIYSFNRIHYFIFTHAKNRYGFSLKN